MFRGAKLVTLTVLLSCAVAADAPAANSTMTVIRVQNMHCESCAAKIRRKLYSVAGVVSVHTNVKGNVAVVTPQRTRQPSPRGLWDAVEKAGFRVIQLKGPLGTFTKKPRR